MRLAYVLKFDLTDPLTSGVLKKVFGQAQTWQALGAETRLFCLTPGLPPQPADVPLTAFHYVNLRSRWRASHALSDAVLAWRPEAIYLRYGAYQPGYLRLMHTVPTVVEVNTDDVHEMRLFRTRNRLYNRLTRARVLGPAAGLVFVSHELAGAAAFRGFTPTRTVIGNGIRLADYATMSASASRNGTARLVWAGTPGSPWHGVDKIVALAQARPQWRFDLVGYTAADVGGQLPANITCHGLQPREAYRRMLEQADIGIGPLALHRNSMHEASALKVREYLATGLPVIIAGRDTDFPGGADFILSLPNTESNVADALLHIDQFVERVRGQRVPRERVAHLDWSVKEVDRLRFIAAVAGRSTR